MSTVRYNQTVNFTILKSSADIEQVCAEARSSGRFGLDTEFLWERTYAPQLCLIQLNVNDKIYVVDPLEEVDISPISGLISDPSVETIMHAPHADLVAFSLRHDADPIQVFDTQITAGFIGYSAGLAYEKLVQEITGVRVQPSESFSDWSRRPLADKQLRYAGEDVEHLLTMHSNMYKNLDERGRKAWALEELKRRYTGADHFLTDPYDAWRKVSRRGKLRGPGLAVLREVAAWRELAARSKDLPVGWIAKDPTLIELARRTPATHADLIKIRGIDNNLKPRDSKELLAAIERGKNAEPLSESHSPQVRGVKRRTAVAKGLATALLRATCEREEIAPELVGTSSDVEELINWVAADKPSSQTPFLLRGWREPFGAELVALAEGRISLQLTDTDPFILIHKQ